MLFRSFLLSCYHFYTAGFGIPQAVVHRGLHLAVTLFVVFLSFSAFGRSEVARGPLAFLGLPLGDWALAFAGAITALYVPYIYDQLAFRVGNPLTIDIIMGTILIVVLLEAVRRSMGWPLPVIACLFIAYAYFGQHMPGIFVHPGASWSNIVNHLYLTSQGIYGTALGVIATYVFHFVLFGVMATRIGLGQLFIDVASALAGRYAGGSAKVSVLSSALRECLLDANVVVGRRLLDGHERVLGLGEAPREVLADALAGRVRICHDDDAALLVGLLDILKRLRLKIKALRDDTVSFNRLVNSNNIHLALDHQYFFYHRISLTA